MINSYMLDHDMTERDIVTMLHWKSVYDAEVERVARVLNNWNFISNSCIEFDDLGIDMQVYAELDSYRCI